MNEYYRVQANIDLDAICNNLRETKKHVTEDIMLMAIIKADGYGHGAVPIAKAAGEIIDAYGVAILEEAIELRNADVTKPILILGFTSPIQYEELLNYEITQTVYTYEMAKELSECATRLNKRAKIHIKLDTGMSRIGFKDDEKSLRIIKEISKLPNLDITGIFTHFACADEADKSSAKKQFERYISFVKKLEEAGVVIPTKHVANSAAILDLPDTYLNMVRSGISTYGLYPSEEVNKNEIKIRPAMELISQVVYVKEVESGVGIGYGSSFITSRNTKVATIPVGYADGYPRALSNKGYVLIKGKKVPIIGRVCMDQFMVDVTDLDEVEVGDRVTLVGTDHGQTITVEELAEMAYSFNYEFVCDISKRVPRVYFKDGKQIGEMKFRGELKYI